MDKPSVSAETHATIYCDQDHYVLAGPNIGLRRGSNNVERDTWMSWYRDNSARSILKSGALRELPFDAAAPEAKVAEPSADRARFMT